MMAMDLLYQSYRINHSVAAVRVSHTAAFMAPRPLKAFDPPDAGLAPMSLSGHPQALADMATQLAGMAARFAEMATCLAVLAKQAAPPAAATAPDPNRFAEVSAALLARAGGGLSLTQGAGLLGVSRQAVHKRVKAGTLLGMMNGAGLVLPKAQFAGNNGRFEALSGLAQVLRLFKSAGGWAALQFLAERDPNLAATPFEALSAGRANDVVHAARAYLDLDEA